MFCFAALSGPLGTSSPLALMLEARQVCLTVLQQLAAPCDCADHLRSSWNGSQRALTNATKMLMVDHDKHTSLQKIFKLVILKNIEVVF